MSIDSIPLTKAQLTQMQSGSPWMQLSAEQEAFIKDAGEGRICMFYGNEILRLPTQRLCEVSSAAVISALNTALGSLSLSLADDVSIEVLPDVLSQDVKRVKVTAADGRTATGIGLVADPRGVH